MTPPATGHHRQTRALAAVLFDMDGVITDTASTHARAWKRAFDAVLADSTENGQDPPIPFDMEADFRQFVDGKPRQDGITSFLGSRGIVVPDGGDNDPPGTGSVAAIAGLKNAHFLADIRENGVAVLPGVQAALARLRDDGVALGLFTSSRNAAAVLKRAGLPDAFDTCVDGNDLRRLGLPGKPDPAMLLEAARRLGAAPAQTAVVEDSVAGIRAAVAGEFALVLGAAPDDQVERLREAGADMALNGIDGLPDVLASWQAEDPPRTRTPPEAGRDPGTPADGWHFVYESYDPAREKHREALCTLGNGYFAARGAAPNSTANEIHYPGTYLAGGYNRLTTEIGGRLIENEDLVNLPNWLPLTFRIEGGDWFSLDRVEILTFRQCLDLRTGVLERRIRFRDRESRTSRWTERRIVSMADPHLAALSVELTAEDWQGHVIVRGGLDGSVVNANVPRYQALTNRHLDTLELDHLGDVMFLRARTNQSLIHVAMAARTRIFDDLGEVDADRRTELGEDKLFQDLAFNLQEGRSVTVEKVVSLHTSRDSAISEPGLEAKRALAHAGRFTGLLADHGVAWQQIWDECDITLEDHGTVDTELKLRVYIFHLLQTVSEHSAERDVGVPARGWHGEAYRGHVFWDELFIFPFLSLRMPNLTRALLRYRHRRLPEARRAAQSAGYQGAMFPWQSGSNGREESQRLHFNPNSQRWVPDNTHRQRHVSAAIAYNIWQYHQATDDHEFLYFYGAEMMLEIARFWASIATYNPTIDRYEIKGVVGPDEYHTGYPGTAPEDETGLDNNTYTNVMAAWVLSRACDVAELLPKLHSRKLCARISLDLEELDRWQDISRKLKVPFHEDGILSQFDGYSDLEEFDWAGYAARYGDIQRLDRILEAEGDSTNRYKASKQADVLMLFYLFSADELRVLFEQLGYPFQPDLIPRTIDYYLARTSHGSTLSRIAHSWVLARSDRARSWHLFQDALESDIADTQGGTTQEGIHVGAMAGTIDLIQRCYLGIEMRANVLHFDPALPDNLSRVKVRLRYRRQILEIDANHHQLRITSLQVSAPAITVAYRGRVRDVSAGDTYTFRLIRRQSGEREEPREGLIAGQ